MKKKIKTVLLSCLACASMLAYGVMPVRAVGPGSNCPHEYFALSLDGPTGEYEYLESGHYQVWGVGHACLRCGYEYYTDIHLEWDSDHEWADEPSEVEHTDTAIIEIFDCVTDGCSHSLFVYSSVI